MNNSYSKAGVDVKKADSALDSIKGLISSTHNRNVVSIENGFAALYEISEEQVLASATDGVGTKLDIAIKLGVHNTIGVDLVAMVVNDLAVYGIKPLFFLDYLATSKLDTKVFVEVIEGIVEGCKEAGCALIGGETAEMPGFYPDEKYDLAGFAVGLANKGDLILGKDIKHGDVIIGLASSGLHSNGFSLVRKIIKDNKLSLKEQVEDKSLGEVLITPTRIYTSIVQSLQKAISLKGLAHITGGGFAANIKRILPSTAKAVISKESWKRPAIFSYLQEKGNIAENEMFDIFNMGVGMCAVVEEGSSDALIKTADNLGIDAFEIGWIENGEQEVVVEQ